MTGAHICRWDLKVKPSAPCGRFRHAGAVRGIAALNDCHLVTAGMDARLLLWDVRSHRAAAARRGLARPQARACLPWFPPSQASQRLCSSFLATSFREWCQTGYVDSCVDSSPSLCSLLFFLTITLQVCHP